MDDRDSGQREKFPEPRGWAMNWVFAQEINAQLAELEQASTYRSGKKFVNPRGWAMEWDGFALSEAEKQRSGNGSTLSEAERQASGNEFALPEVEKQRSGNG